MNLIKIIILMAYLNLTCKVSIGAIYFDSINSLEVEDDINKVSNSATITLPRNYKELEGRPVLDYIKAGDPVTIEFGYDGIMHVEFTGFAKAPSADIPLEIECDELYPFRQNNLIKSYRAVTLKQLLGDLTEGFTAFDGTPFKLECPTVNLGKFLIDNASSYQVLERLRSDYGFFTKVYGNVLHVGWAYDWNPAYTNRHKYIIQEYVKSARDLKWKRKEDFNVRIRVKINNKDGKHKFAEYGSLVKKAAVTTIERGATTEQEAKDMAKARYQKVVYDGYTGSITGAGIPRVNAGDSLVIVDKEQPEREGTYLVQKVVKTYGDDGISRKCTLSYKI